MIRYVFVALVLSAGPVALAADAIKLDLSTFKWKAGFDGGDELGGYDNSDERFFLNTNGTATGEVNVPEDGEYTVTVEASCTEAQKEFAKFKVTCGEVVVTKEHACTTEDKKAYTFTAKLTKGKQKLAVEFLNDAYKENEYDRNLFVYAVKLEKK
jgi:hypothetical protein